jgi:hypothetical protein
MTGLASVTFRSLSTGRIIGLAKNANLDGIEWGGDIHVPPGDIALAVKIRVETLKAGLKVLSYGSYYKTLTGGVFTPVLETAVALNEIKGSPISRRLSSE